MEVHEPEAPINSLHDFFIHIATICVGLLIATGLEQSVDWHNHRTESNELLRASTEDTRLMVEDCKQGEKFSHDLMKWAEERRRQVNSAIWTGKPLEPYARMPDDTFIIVTDPSWRAGKASGLLSVVPQADVIAFSELDTQVDFVREAIAVWQPISAKRGAFESSFANQNYDAYDPSKASTAELREYLRVLTEEDIALGNLLSKIRQTHGAADAVLRGDRGLRVLEKAEVDADTDTPVK